MTSAADPEQFQLQPAEYPPPFAVSLRITPELWDVLRDNAIAKGTAATIRFGDSATDNEILVANRSFHFTSFEESRCDVYKRPPKSTSELQDAGRVLRKCKVQRQLNEDEASRVKQRCADSEALRKARKSEPIGQHAAAHLQATRRRPVVTSAFVAARSRAQPSPRAPAADPARRCLSADVLRQQKTGVAPCSLLSPGGKSPGRAVGGGVELVNLAPQPQQPKPPPPPPSQHQQQQSYSQPQPTRAAGCVELSAAECAERVAVFASRAREKGVAPLRAVLLALLSDRPLSLKAIKRSVDEMPRTMAQCRELREAAEEAARSNGALLDRQLKDIAQLKAPGRYHLRLPAEKEWRELERATSKSAFATRGGGPERANTSAGEPETSQPPANLMAANLMAANLQTKAPGRLAEAPRVVVALPQRAAQQQQNQLQEEEKEASRRGAPGPELGLLVGSSGNTASPERKRRAEEGQGERSIKKKKATPLAEWRSHRPAATSSPASHLSVGRLGAAAHSVSQSPPSGPGDCSDDTMLYQRSAAGLAEVEEAEKLLDAWEEGHQAHPAAVASHSQFQEYRSRYEQMFPIYLRLHKMLTSSASEFLALEQQWKAAGSPGSKAKLEDKLWEYYQLRHERYALTNRVCMALHMELKAIKCELKIYEDAKDKNG